MNRRDNYTAPFFEEFDSADEADSERDSEGDITMGDADDTSRPVRNAASKTQFGVPSRINAVLALECPASSPRANPFVSYVTAVSSPFSAPMNPLRRSAHQPRDDSEPKQHASILIRSDSKQREQHFPASSSSVVHPVQTMANEPNDRSHRQQREPIVICSDSEELEKRSPDAKPFSSQAANSTRPYVSPPFDRDRRHQRVSILIRSDSEEREERQRLLALDRAQKGALHVVQLAKEEQEALKMREKARSMWDEAEGKDKRKKARGKKRRGGAHTAFQSWAPKRPRYRYSANDCGVARFIPADFHNQRVDDEVPDDAAPKRTPPDAPSKSWPSPLPFLRKTTNNNARKSKFPPRAAFHDEKSENETSQNLHEGLEIDPELRRQFDNLEELAKFGRTSTRKKPMDSFPILSSDDVLIETLDGAPEKSDRKMDKEKGAQATKETEKRDQEWRKMEKEVQETLRKERKEQEARAEKHTKEEEEALKRRQENAQKQEKMRQAADRISSTWDKVLSEDIRKRERADEEARIKQEKAQTERNRKWAAMQERYRHEEDHKRRKEAQEAKAKETARAEEQAKRYQQWAEEERRRWESQHGPPPRAQQAPRGGRQQGPPRACEPTQPTNYDLLGVTRRATKDQIKAAYRKLSMAHHPDRVPPEEVKSATARMAIINHAYDVLSDTAQRSAYDRATFGY